MLKISDSKGIKGYKVNRRAKKSVAIAFGSVLNYWDELVVKNIFQVAHQAEISLLRLSFTGTLNAEERSNLA